MAASGFLPGTGLRDIDCQSTGPRAGGAGTPVGPRASEVPEDAARKQCQLRSGADGASAAAFTALLSGQPQAPPAACQEPPKIPGSHAPTPGQCARQTRRPSWLSHVRATGPVSRWAISRPPFLSTAGTEGRPSYPHCGAWDEQGDRTEH